MTIRLDELEEMVNKKGPLGSEGKVAKIGVEEGVVVVGGSVMSS